MCSRPSTRCVKKAEGALLPTTQRQTGRTALLPTVQLHKYEKIYQGINYRPFSITRTKRAILPTVQRQKSQGGSITDHLTSNWANGSIADRSASKIWKKLVPGYTLPTVQRHKDEHNFYYRPFSVKRTKLAVYILPTVQRQTDEKSDIYIYNIYIQHNHSNTYIYTRYILPTVQRKTGEQLHYRPFSARRVRRGHESDIERGSSSAR